MPIGSRIVLATLATALIGCSCWAQAGSEQQTLWRGIKHQLSGPNGAQYFEALKGALLPPIKGALISAIVKDGLSKLTVGITDSEIAEVTLVFHTGDKRVKGNPKPGTQIEFDGVAMEFTKEPFMLTLDVSADGLRGLELEPSKPIPKEPPPKKQARPHRAARSPDVVLGALRHR